MVYDWLSTLCFASAVLGFVSFLVIAHDRPEKAGWDG
ncbi:hypothetical protein C8N35_102380 [Breoghania corrubedonensis]|uniref:Uncharacterized protein n=1 Tax=Breoghania corrubedonensis TaxID=665038 RepID=A0A2T5VD52_9HYPH|nr:hypothetical protein C8N35_102380 [Breoghania corrubedonensis]